MDDGTQDVQRAMRRLNEAIDAALLDPARAAIDRLVADINATSDDLVITLDDIDLRLSIEVSWDDGRGRGGSAEANR